MNGTDVATGRLGAVLRAVGTPHPVELDRSGVYLATTLEHARAVLTQPDTFDFPFDVSRERVRGRSSATPSAGPPTPHLTTAPIGAEQVQRGVRTLRAELEMATGDRREPASVDAMELLRVPVARSTVAAVLPDLDADARARVGDRTLHWIDALAPVIASPRPPARWSKVRRDERGARAALNDALSSTGVARPVEVATVLAAGIQVPIAAGAWLLVLLARHPHVVVDLRRDERTASAAAWETLRLFPPTWLMARVATRRTELGGVTVDRAAIVLVSPLALGRLESLVPAGERDAGVETFDPGRWRPDGPRPGQWLPFGAGPHACPGRNLGLAQLRHLAAWAASFDWHELEPAVTDQSRGLFPNPAILHRRVARQT